MFEYDLRIITLVRKHETVFNAVENLSLSLVEGTEKVSHDESDDRAQYCDSVGFWSLFVRFSALNFLQYLRPTMQHHPFQSRATIAVWQGQVSVIFIESHSDDPVAQMHGYLQRCAFRGI